MVQGFLYIHCQPSNLWSFLLPSAKRIILQLDDKETTALPLGLLYILYCKMIKMIALHTRAYTRMLTLHGSLYIRTASPGVNGPRKGLHPRGHDIQNTINITQTQFTRHHFTNKQQIDGGKTRRTKKKKKTKKRRRKGRQIFVFNLNWIFK